MTKKGIDHSEVATAITFGPTRGYAVMTMTGAQVKELAETGFDAAGDGEAYPWASIWSGKCRHNAACILD